MDFGQPFPALFSGVPAEWRAAAELPLQQALKTRAGHWLWHRSDQTISDVSVYGTQLDFAEGTPAGEITSFWSQYLTTFLYIEAEKDMPAEMATDLIALAQKNSATYRAEATARGARNGVWHEWGPCEACAEKKNYFRLFADAELYRCRHCGRWAELVVETDCNMRRHHSDFDWEKALPLMGGDKWLKPLKPETAILMIREKLSGGKSDELEARRRHQAAAERSFRLPRPVAITDALPLAEQLFEKLGLAFVPVRRVLADGTEIAEGKSGLSVAWADVTPDPFSADDVFGGGPYNQCARITVPPCEVSFSIFASRLDAFTITGPMDEVRRIAAEIKAICS